MLTFDLKSKVRAVFYGPPGVNPSEDSMPKFDTTAKVKVPKGDFNVPEYDNPDWIYLSGQEIFLGPVEKVSGWCNTGIKTLKTVMNVLIEIMKIIQLFIVCFGSFSALFSSVVKMTKKYIEQTVTDLLNSGAYVNVIIPPAFLDEGKGNSTPLWLRLASGGFQGFLSTLEVSLNDTQDVNRPIFSKNASVGGLIMMADAESLDKFYAALKFFAEVFDFMDLIPINLTPPPPTNLRGVSSMFVDPKDGKRKKGIQLEWDVHRSINAPYYKISRCIRRGGVEGVEEIVHTKLKDFLAQIRWSLKPPYLNPSKKRVTLYVPVLKENDPDGGKDEAKPWFNNGSDVIVRANPINGGGKYIDFDIAVDGSEPVYTQYYYKVESGVSDSASGIWGKPTQPLEVLTGSKCLDPNMYPVIEHQVGNNLYYAELMGGIGPLGKWSTFRPLMGFMPFLSDIFDYIYSFLDMLEGVNNNASKSYLTFLKGIQEKLTDYGRIMNAVVQILERIKDLFQGLPTIGFLNLPPAKGGAANFMKRVRSAKAPTIEIQADGGSLSSGESEEKSVFSGPGGLTIGVVIVYGFVTEGTFANPDTKVTERQWKATKKTFDLLSKLIT